MSDAEKKHEVKTGAAGQKAGGKKKKKSNKGGFLKEFITFSIYLLSILILTWLLMTYVVQRTVVEGESMENCLQDGDNLLVDKFTYRSHEPKRFDVVVFPYAYDAKTYYIKRVIGLPGETVYIDGDGVIYINEEKLEENYGNEVILDGGLATGFVFLGSDEYFVLGDNRNHSTDSRDPSVGPVKRDSIIGRAAFRIWPFSKFGKINK
ncbi:MAG: signal peptidase I [Lachnospiraceae bacterium]|nr:signal peptidase I [Lachnospiraceae bacterium]